VNGKAYGVDGVMKAAGLGVELDYKVNQCRSDPS
jgi:hypothetical protein